MTGRGRSDRRPEPEPPRWVKARERKARILLYAAIAFFFFLVVVSIVGQGGVYDVYQLWQRNKAKEADIRRVAEENHFLRGSIYALQHDPHAVEKIAREELGLVKPGETVYVFVPPPRNNPAGGSRGGSLPANRGVGSGP